MKHTPLYMLFFQPTYSSVTKCDRITSAFFLENKKKNTEKLKIKENDK